MGTVIAIATILAAFIGFGIWLYTRGRQSQRGDDAAKIDKVQDAQLDAANQPRDPKTTSDKLRSGKF